MNTMSMEEFRALESEEDFMTRVIAEAKEKGWMVQHVRPSIVTKNGEKVYRTAIQGDKGGPDLLLARRGRVVFMELKAQYTETKKDGGLSKDQRAWRNAIVGDFGPPGLNTYWYLFRPGDWALVRRVLA